MEPSGQVEEGMRRVDHAAVLSKRTKLVILFGVLLSLFLAALDQTIVTTALPAIVRDFNGIDLVSWVSTGYLLASTAMVPIYGKLSDLYGRKRVLLVGIVLFLIGSALCGASSTMLQLIWYRVIQGAGAAAITSTALATPADLFAPVERAKYMGIFGAVYGLASVVGPFIGGLLTDQISWHWVFYVNVPLGLVAIGFVWKKMPNLSSGMKVKIDWVGTVVLIVAVVCLMLGLSLDKQLYGWLSLPVVGLLGVFLVASLIFMRVEALAESPVISLKLFRNRTFAIGIMASVLNGMAFFGAVIFLSLFIVNVLGKSATEAGTSQIPLMVAFVISSNVASMIVHRWGRYKPLIVIGFGIMTLGFWWMMQLGPESSLRDVMYRTFLVGLGIGPAMPLLNLAIQNAVSFDQIGSATAARQFFQQLGQAVGGAAFGLVLTTMLKVELSKNFETILMKLPEDERSQLDVSELRHMAGKEESPQASVDVILKFREGMKAQLSEVRMRVDEGVKRPELWPEILGDRRMPARVGATIRQALPARGDFQREVDRALIEEDRWVEEEAAGLKGEVKRAIQVSFARSITSIYQYTMGLSILAMILVWGLMPELKLKVKNG